MQDYQNRIKNINKKTVSKTYFYITAAITIVRYTKSSNNNYSGC